MSNAAEKNKTVELKTRSEIDVMRKAGKVAGGALAEVGRNVRAGISTSALDKIAENFIRSHGAVPTFKGYHGYPASICTSINEEVVHGIPGPRTLKEGDIIGVDVGATLDGFVGDTAKTFCVGQVKSDVKKLVDATKESLDRAITEMIPGKRLGDIGAAVQDFVEPLGYGVVRDFVGHGIGRQMHEAPAVPNYGKKGTGLRLDAGLVLAVEPMVTAGDYAVQMLDDGWTVITKDKKWSAHFEHTIAITEGGPVVLTQVD